MIDVTGDSLAVDSACSPTASSPPTPPGPPIRNTMAAILSMDSVAASEVQNVLDKFNHDFALVRLAGAVVGTADGSATEMEVRGVYLFDRKLQRVTRFNLAVKEKRIDRRATPGLDGVAKLRMNVKPLESSPHLLPATLATLRRTSDLKLDMLQLEPAKQGYRVQHDRRWIVTSNGRESTTLRRVERRRRAGPVHDHQPATQAVPAAKRRSTNSNATSASRSRRSSASWSPAANGRTPSATIAWRSSSAARPKKSPSSGTTTWSAPEAATAFRSPSRSKAKWSTASPPPTGNSSTPSSSCPPNR